MTDDPTPLHRSPAEGIWLSWLGSPTRFVATGEETADTYCLSLATSAAGGGAPPHRHDFEEGFYLLSGRLTFIAGNQRFELAAGDFINIGANDAHAIRNESGEPAEVITLCAPAGFDRFQIEGGFPMDGPDGELTPDSDAVRERILASAKKHGVDMNPPDSAFETAPRATVTRRAEGLMIDTVGDRYRFLARSDDTAGRYAVWEAVLGPGGGPPPHIHTREEEAFYVLEGALTFHTPAGSFRATAGHFVHLPRSGLHWFRNETEEEARALILVAPAGFENMFLETGTRVDSYDAPLTPPDPEEKHRILKTAPRFGVQIIPPSQS